MTPTPLTRRVAHAMQAFEYRRLARHMIANGGLYTGHIIRMHQRAPIRRLADVGLVIAQHGFPARRQIHPVIDGIEVPQAVVGTVQASSLRSSKSRR